MHIVSSLKVKFQIIMLLMLMIHIAMDAAASSLCNAVRPLVDVTFNVEYGDKKSSFVFKNVCESAMRVLDREIATPTEYVLRIQAKDLKESHVAFGTVTQSGKFGLCVVHDVNEKAAEIRDSACKALEPLLAEDFDHKLHKFIKIFHEELQKIRSDLHTSGNPSEFSAVWTVGFEKKKKYYHIGSFYEQNEKRYASWVHGLTVFKNDILTVDFTKVSKDVICAQNVDPFIEHLRKIPAYYAAIRLYAEDSSRYPVDSLGDGLLHLATLLHDTEAIKRALEKPLFRKHINDRSKHGRTASDYALLLGHTDIVDLLIANGAE